MKINHIILPVLLCLTGSATAAITIAGGNGSFETNTRGTATFTETWYLNPQAGSGIHATQWSSITGWTLTAPGGGTANSATAWLMTGNTFGGSASDGNYHINVEGGPNWWLSTSISGLTVGNNYTVFFDAKQRSGGSGNFDVFVNTTVPTGGFNITPTSSWAQQSFTFTAQLTSHTLTISNVDHSTYVETLVNNGVMVDNFSVVPEPSAALLGGLGLLALLRRRR
jgi:hypothetical protein